MGRESFPWALVLGFWPDYREDGTVALNLISFLPLNGLALLPNCRLTLHVDLGSNY